MNLFFDTETTGLPLFREPSNDPRQPHLVQFAALLLDDDGAERMTINLMIKPDGWEIPAKAAAIHGITTEIATRYGVAENIAVRVFLDLVQKADIVVAAHNESFDWRIMRIAMLRAGKTKKEIEAIEQCERICTMQMADAVMKLPPTEKMLAAGFTKSKPPTVTECMAHFFNEAHDKAHDAMADVRACARIWQAILAGETEQAEAA